MSRKTEKRRDLRHRNMERSRNNANEILKKIPDVTDEDEKQKMWKRFSTERSNSTRKANQL